MIHPHWQHFLSLEKDFIQTLDFVELDKANEKTFSITYTKLLLAICSEIDVVSKLLCQKVDPSSKANNIDDYRIEIKRKYPNFYTIKVWIPRYTLDVKPWINWRGHKNPKWWGAHNKVKHQRNVHNKLANQKYVKEALCGLFCLLLYLYQPELYSGNLEPLPFLLDYEGMPGHFKVNPGAVLPDIPR